MSNDLKIIKQIENQIGFNLQQAPIEELKINFFFVGGKYYETRFGYDLDKNNNVTGLSLDGAALGLETVKLIVQLPHLKCASFSKVDYEDFSFLKEIESLTQLNLGGNNLSDVSFLKDLTGLTHLNLSRNENIKDHSILSNLSNLTSLSLYGNELSDVSFLKDLTSLTHLDLSWGEGISDYSVIKLLSNLTSLNLYGNELSDVSFLKDLTGLTRLDLSENEGISDYSVIKLLSNLTNLNLDGNDLSDVSFLKDLPGLTHLDLSRNENIKDYAILSSLSNLTNLSLLGNDLSDVSFLKDLRGLTHLDLSNNENIKDYSILSNLSNLTNLNLDENDLSDVSFLKDLTGLTHLDLNVNENIKDYSNLSSLSNLTSLSLIGNKLSDVSFLKNLTGLTHLNLNVNKNIKDHSILSNLSNLNGLSLYGNKLSHVSFLKDLRGLTHLCLSGNKLSDVSFLKDLRGLIHLDLSRNALSDVNFLKDLPNLLYVGLDENPIKNPPPEIVEKGIEAIRNYFDQIEKQGSSWLYEAKLLFVGEPGAGKTTLRKKIMNPNHLVPQEDPNQDQSTLGIEIESGWTFDHCDDKTIPFRTHMWDFGGQPIQYMLHQYFLTSRSLYVLVSDDRRQHTRFDYWFDIIKVLGDKSPVLVVLNENKHRSISDFDFKGYRNRYVDDYAIEKRDVDLSKNDGRFKELKGKIQEMLCHLEHIGDELPAQWLPIRKELEEIKNENQIGIQRYFEICRKHGLASEEDMLYLCGYLNALGVVLHYRDDSTLEDTLFINPHWIMDGLYTVLVDKTLEKGQGKFDKKWLFGIWEEKGYSYEERCKLFNLMLKDNFELCYAISGRRDKYMVPLLLPDVPPDYQRPSGEGLLNFRFQYPIFPEGIIPRLMVRLNEYIEKKGDKDLIWKKGGLLHKANNRALVREDRSAEGLAIIDISVSGEINSNRDFLAQIRGEIEKIHNKSFKGIDCEEMIPCNCEQCTTNSSPYFFKLSELQRYMKKGRTNIDCSFNVQPVSIEELISGVMVIQENEWDRIRHQFKNMMLADTGFHATNLYPVNEANQHSSYDPLPDNGEKNQDLKKVKNLQKQIIELKEQIETEENRKSEWDKVADCKMNRRDWWVGGFGLFGFAAIAVLVVIFDWNAIEKWTYIGSGVLGLFQLIYFTIFKKRYDRGERRARRLEKEQKKLYNRHGVNLKIIERLKQDIAEAKNQRRAILN